MFIRIRIIITSTTTTSVTSASARDADPRMASTSAEATGSVAITKLGQPTPVIVSVVVGGSMGRVGQE
jgi:hypothetical protein